MTFLPALNSFMPSIGASPIPYRVTIHGTDFVAGDNNLAQVPLQPLVSVPGFGSLFSEESINRKHRPIFFAQSTKLQKVIGKIGENYPLGDHGRVRVGRRLDELWEGELLSAACGMVGESFDWQKVFKANLTSAALYVMRGQEQDFETAVYHFHEASGNLGKLKDAAVAAVIAMELAADLRDRIKAPNTIGLNPLFVEKLKKNHHSAAANLWLGALAMLSDESASWRIARDRGLWHAAKVGDYGTMEKLFLASSKKKGVTPESAITDYMGAAWTRVMAKSRSRDDWKIASEHIMAAIEIWKKGAPDPQIVNRAREFAKAAEEFALGQ